ncbi:ATP-dependent zinc metalloprotease FtsH 2 [compost metagenome]
MTEVAPSSAEELARARSYSYHFRKHLEQAMFASIHGPLTQKIGLIFAVTGISSRLAYHIFVRTLQTDADSTWLPDYSSDYGRTVFIHHDRVESKAVTLSAALSVRNTGNHLIYLADRAEDLPAIIRDNASAIIEPSVNAFALAVAAFRDFHADLSDEARRKFKIFDAEKTAATSLDQVFYKNEGVVFNGKQFRRIDKPGAFLSEIYFMFRDFAYEAQISARAVVLCADWQKPPTRASDVSRDELADVPLLDDFPGIANFRPRLSTLLDRYNSPRPPRSGILLYGPPGTGKTMLARTIAKTTGRSLIATSVSGWQSGNHLSDFLATMSDDFRRAREMSPSMIFIDELDSIPDRRNRSSAHQFYETAVTNRFLELIDGFTGCGDVLVVGATNNKTAIDPAVLRAGRFGEHVHVPYPDHQGIMEILAWYLGRAECAHGISADVDASELATRMPGIPPSSIRSIVDEAVDECNRRREPLDGVHFEIAFDAAAANMGFVRGGYLADIERVTVHEAGHAVAMHLIRPGSIDSVRIAADLTTAGYVKMSPSWIAGDDVRADIGRGIACMSGRAAEYLVLGPGRIGYGNGMDITMARHHAVSLAESGLTPDGFAEFLNPEDRSAIEAAVSKWMTAFNRASLALLKDQVHAVKSLADIFSKRMVLDGTDCHAHLQALGLESNTDLSKLIAL